jgi:hypothetical protein
VDCRAAVAEPCAAALTKRDAFSVAWRDTISVTQPIKFSVTIADAWCHTFAVAKPTASPDSGHAWSAAF